MCYQLQQFTATTYEYEEPTNNFSHISHCSRTHPSFSEAVMFSRLLVLVLISCGCKLLELVTHILTHQLFFCFRAIFGSGTSTQFNWQYVILTILFVSKVASTINTLCGWTRVSIFVRTRCTQNHKLQFVSSTNFHRTLTFNSHSLCPSDVWIRI